MYTASHRSPPTIRDSWYCTPMAENTRGHTQNEHQVVDDDHHHIDRNLRSDGAWDAKLNVRLSR